MPKRSANFPPQGDGKRQKEDNDESTGQRVRCTHRAGQRVRCAHPRCADKANEIYKNAKSYRSNHHKKHHVGERFLEPVPCAEPAKVDLQASVLTSEQVQELCIDHFDSCRISKERKISVIDAIKIFKGCTSHAAKRAWQEARNLYGPETPKNSLLGYVTKSDFPGKGNTGVDVAPFWVIVIVLSQLPSTRNVNACVLRANMTAIFLRVYAGDKELLQTIANNNALISESERQEIIAGGDNLVAAAAIAPPTEQKEKEINQLLCAQTAGISEFSTPAGFADVVDETTVYEIKAAHLWKHALGQVLAYGAFLPKKTKQIVLFDSDDNQDRDMIVALCAQFSVQVVFWQ